VVGAIAISHIISVRDFCLPVFIDQIVIAAARRSSGATENNVSTDGGQGDACRARPCNPIGVGISDAGNARIVRGVDVDPGLDLVAEVYRESLTAGPR